jgi:hypothetical protein
MKGVCARGQHFILVNIGSHVVDHLPQTEPLSYLSFLSGYVLHPCTISNQRPLCPFYELETACPNSLQS